MFCILDKLTFLWPWMQFASKRSIKLQNGSNIQSLYFNSYTEKTSFYCEGGGGGQFMLKTFLSKIHKFIFEKKSTHSFVKKIKQCCVCKCWGLSYLSLLAMNRLLHRCFMNLAGYSLPSLNVHYPRKHHSQIRLKFNILMKIGTLKL